MVGERRCQGEGAASRSDHLPGWTTPRTPASDVEDALGQFLLTVLQGLLTIAAYLIIASAIVSWLVAFGVFNTRNETMRRIVYGLDAITAPLLAPFRRFIPPIGGFDVTPIIALIVLFAARDHLLPWIFRPLVGALGG